MGQPTTKKAAPKKPASKPTPTPEPAAEEAADVVGSQHDYERFLPAAQALEARDVRPFRLDPSLAYHNVQRAAAALEPMATRITEELPKVHLDDLRALPRLALALSFAASQVDRGGGTSKSLAEPLSKAYALRETMLASAVSLALAGTVPKREVEKIQEGRGKIDAAQDCVDLAAFFKRHAAAVRGKTPVTAAMITEAATLGTELLQVLRPTSAKRDRAPQGALKEAIDIRNRLATLLHQRHELARRAGHWLWGDDVDKHVPPLQARAASKRKAAKEPNATKDPKAAKTSAPKGDKGEP